MPAANGSPGVSPWDAPIPHRPIADDFNGCVKTDDPKASASDPVTMPNAAEWNTKGLSLVSIGKTIGSIVSVIFVAGAPVISTTCIPSNVLSPSAFTIGRTAGGSASGDTTIFWTASSFPPATASPIATRNDTALNGSIGATSTPGQARVVTGNGGVATDVPYTIVIR